MPSQPISIKPSGSWLGNDGYWSTIAVNIGSPGQPVSLLPATSVSSIWPVLVTGCQIYSNPAYYSDPSNCSTLRGGTFNSSDSLSFNATGSFSLPYVPTEAAIGYTNTTANVGTDDVTLVLSDRRTTISNQTIAAFQNKSPFLGLFGLSGYANHVSTFGVSGATSTPLLALNDEGTISAKSYGFTAGRYYPAEKELVSLTLGGFDQNRGDPFGENAIAIGFNQDWQRDLQVLVKSIIIDGSEQNAVSGEPDDGVMAFIDSVVPEIWLPEGACQAFERAFGLVWDDTAKYYIVNDTQHDTLLSQDKSVTFTLAANSSSSETIIKMPYGAFDQALQWPLANGSDDQETSYRYFPLKRANDSQQYVLGRTFLQEAYLTVDYGNGSGVFYVSQAKTPGGSDTDLVCLGCEGDSSKSGLSTGAIAGIAVAAAVVILMIAAYFFWRWKKKRDIRKLRAELQVTSRGSIGGTTIQDDDPHNIEFFKPTSPAEEEVKPELDGSSAIPAGFVQYGRHELASNGSVRRTSQQSGLSRGTISPISGRMPSHARNLSYGSSNGQPSPSAGDSPSPGQGAWGASPHGSPDPEMREVRHQSGGQWYFELPANPRSPQSPRPALDVIQSTNAAPAEPVEVRADPRSPTEPDSASRFREDLRE